MAKLAAVRVQLAKRVAPCSRAGCRWRRHRCSTAIGNCLCVPQSLSGEWLAACAPEGWHAESDIPRTCV